MSKVFLGARPEGDARDVFSFHFKCLGAVDFSRAGRAARVIATIGRRSLDEIAIARRLRSRGAR
jgi:hypothetical protein